MTSISGMNNPSNQNRIFARQDTDQNELITKNESPDIRNWTNDKNSRKELNSIIVKVINETEPPSGTDRTALANHLYSTLSKSVISQLTQTVTDILNSFQGLFVGSVDITGKPKDEVTGLQDSLNNKATQGIADVIAKFNTEYNNKLLNITSTAEATARNEIESYKPNGKQPEYKSIGERQVNGEKQDVFKAGENYYINRGTTTNPRYEQIFLVDDGGVVGKKKFVTEDTKIQLGLDQNESGDIDTNKVKVNGKGDKEISLIRNEGEKIGGHKTYSDAQGNQYIRSNYEYFEMNSDAGLLLQKGGSVEFDDNKEPYIRYNGKSYKLGSEGLKTAAEDIRKKNTEIETENLKNGPGVYDADVLKNERIDRITQEVTTLYDGLITKANLGELNNEEQAQLNTAKEADIAASIEANKASATNTENAIIDIKGKRTPPTTSTTSTTSTPQTPATSAPQAGQGNGSVSNEIQAANREIRSWTDGRMDRTDAQNKAKKDGTFPENVTGFIDNILNGIGDALTNEQKNALRSNEKFKQKIITANPSVFNSDGSLKGDAKTSKFDFPSVATMKAFLATLDSKATTVITATGTYNASNKTLTATYQESGETKERKATGDTKESAKEQMIADLVDEGYSKDNITINITETSEQPATTQTYTEIAEQIYTYADKYSGDAEGEANSAIKMYNHIEQKITSDNVVEVWNSYAGVQSDDTSILDSFGSEWLSEGEGGGRDAAFKATMHIIEQLEERAEAFPNSEKVQAALEDIAERKNAVIGDKSSIEEGASKWINGNGGLAKTINGKSYNGAHGNFDSCLTALFEEPIDKLVKAIDEAEKAKKQPQTQEATT